MMLYRSAHIHIRNHTHRGPFAFFCILLLAILMVAASPLGAEVAASGKVRSRAEVFDQSFLGGQSRLMWSTNASMSETTRPLDTAIEYIQELNRSRYAGYSDWRLPTREELLSLVNHVKSLGFDGRTSERSVAAGLHSLGLRGIRDSDYWTSTENIYNSGEAWFINMMNGSAGTGMKTLYLYILPARTVPEGNKAP